MCALSTFASVCCLKQSCCLHCRSFSYKYICVWRSECSTRYNPTLHCKKISSVHNKYYQNQVCAVGIFNKRRASADRCDWYMNNAKQDTILANAGKHILLYRRWHNLTRRCNYESLRMASWSRLNIGSNKPDVLLTTEVTVVCKKTSSQSVFKNVSVAIKCCCSYTLFVTSTCGRGRGSLHTLAQSLEPLLMEAWEQLPLMLL